MFQLGHVFSDMDRQERRVEFFDPKISFNWATSFQTWIEVQVRPRRIPSKGFNWATSFQTWIDTTTCFVRTGHMMFQLGHVSSDMDSKCLVYIGKLYNPKFQLGHDFSDMDSGTRHDE